MKKRFGKESALAAYDAEMNLRTQGVDRSAHDQAAGTPPSGELAASPWPPSGRGQDAPILEIGAIAPAGLVQQPATHYRAYVAVASSDGSLGWGYAEEPEYGLAWELEAGGSLAFQMVLEDCPDALAICLAKALQQAVGRLSTKKPLSQRHAVPDVTPAAQSRSGPVLLPATPRLGGPGDP